MSRLNYRSNCLLYDANSEPNWGAAYSITAYPIGARAASASAGTTITVNLGHGFIAGQKLLVGTDTTKYREVSSVTETTVVADQAVAVSAGDLILNLGADTGSSVPNYDGSPVKAYTSADKSSAATYSTVTSDSQGNYAYWHQGSNFWELIRDSGGDPDTIVPGIGGGRPGEVNAVDFGADPADSTVGSAKYIERAIDSIKQQTAHPTGATGAMGGVVILPSDDDGAYGWEKRVEVPYGVSVIGIGKPRLLCTTSDLAVMLSVDSESGSPPSNRLGTIENLFFDGDDIGEIGLYVGKCVDRHFRNITAEKFDDTGIVLDRCQNSHFTMISVNKCNLATPSSAGTLACGVRLENNSNNNSFSHTNLRDNVPSNLVICEHAAQQTYAKNDYTGGSQTGCTGNNFVGGVWEDLEDTYGTAVVYIRAGNYNSFDGVALVGLSQTVAKPLVKITSEDSTAAGGDTLRTKFRGCHLQGTQTITDAFWLHDAKWTNIDGCDFENVNNVLDWDQLVTIIGTPQADAEQRTYFGPSNNVQSINGNVVNVDAAQNEEAIVWGGIFDGHVRLAYLEIQGNGLVRFRDGGGDGYGEPHLKRDTNATNTFPYVLIENGMFGVNSVATGITAKAGGGQDAALALTAMLNVVETVATANDSVTLPHAKVGLLIMISNRGGNALEVFPYTDEYIHGVAQNTKITLADDASVWLMGTSGSRWEAVLGAVAS
jgi:hypothetical protein